MIRRIFLSGLLLPALLFLAGSVCANSVDHDLQVWLHPDKQKIEVRDRITLIVPRDGIGQSPIFSLTAAARVQPDDRIDALPAVPGAAVRRYRVTRDEASVIEVRYWLPMTAAEAAGDVFLNLARHWLPVFGDELFRFSMQVDAPAAWTAISQGGRDGLRQDGGRMRVRWSEQQPQDDIYLIAGRFFEYRQDAGPVEAMAFLRRDDPELARRYLDATARYVDLYSDMIGPYPYAKFALVENTWESGYGMPSFTLLGPRVIRLPFIIHTSYPHEVLHNWWGNSVYVDFTTGNWSEGLTAYLADHFLSEQRGKGARYRRDALQKYRNYVSGARDFPLTEFRAKHGETTEAVGYNKALMLFHMLRRQLGDSHFFNGLRKFYAEHRFTRAGFDDIRAALEAVSGVPLGKIFTQWLTRTGAPALALAEAETKPTSTGYAVSGELRQTQSGPPFHLQIPVRVTLDDGTAIVEQVPMDGPRRRFEIAVPGTPRSLHVDPDFDLFRQLNPTEVPPTLSELFGADDVVFVTPRNRDAETAQRQQRFIDAASYLGGTRVQSDAEPLPAHGAIWLLGWHNGHRAVVEKALSGQDVGFVQDALDLAGRRWPADATTVTLATRTADGRPLLWTHLQRTPDSAATARRLRHYGRYSLVALTDDQPALRDQWPVLDSPLSATFEHSLSVGRDRASFE